MTNQNGRAFNEWLRAQLKAKKMSQRQLAQQSGVDHSTISRLIRGDRMPSLGTATKLARGLRELRDDADTPQYLGIVAAGAQNPTARVEYALRADEMLTEAQVRQIMEYYLAVRMRRFGRTFQPSEGGDRSQDRPLGRTSGSGAISGSGRVGGPGGMRGPSGVREPGATGGSGGMGGSPGGRPPAASVAMTPRPGTAAGLTGTIRPMARDGLGDGSRPVPTYRQVPRTPGAIPRPINRPPSRNSGY